MTIRKNKTKRVPPAGTWHVHPIRVWDAACCVGKPQGRANGCTSMVPPAARNLFEKRFLDFQKLFICLRQFFLFFLFMSICLPGLAENRSRVITGDFVQTAILTSSLKAQKAEHFVVPQTSSWQNQIKWMVREGNPVKPGDPVVRFDTSNMTADIENIELTLQDKQEQKKQKLAEYQHQKLELELKEKQAEIDYQKKQLDAAVPKGIISDYDYDLNQLNMKKSAEALKKAQLEKQVKLDTMVSEIKQLDLDIEQERSKLEKAEKTLESLTLKAKTAGTVVYAQHRWENRKIQVGDTVFSTGTVATIPDPNSLQVEAWANETHINHVKPGQRADIILDAYPNKRFSGTIKDVLKSAEKRKNWGKAHYFNVSIELDNRDLTIMKPGMSAKCLVHTGEISQVLLVPIQMAHFDGQLFRIKPKGKEALEIKPLGINAFYLAVSKDETIDEGTVLEKIKGEVQ